MTQSKIVGHRFGAWSVGVVLGALLALLGGCGGASGGNPARGAPGADEQGEVIIGVTDADGDFLSYAVDVVSLKLRKADGTEVETAPLATRVDFAQYIDVTEFFTAATIPAGRYVAAEMTLDYSDADVQVEVNNAAVSAQLRDAAGSGLATLTLKVQLDPARPLFIRPGVPAHLTVDFDLAASNSVDLSVSPPMITVEPFLLAEVNPLAPKPHRLRGLLGAVNEAGNWFVTNLRPFHMGSGRFGSLRVHTVAETSFEVDGTAYVGDAGLSALAGLVPTSAVVVYGKLDIDARQFVAFEVYAGASVPWNDNDMVRGTVIARSGDVLTVRGATVVRASGSVIFNDDVLVTMGAHTRVTQQLSADNSLNIDAVSVGQGIVAIGVLAESSTGTLQLDAADGHVRMLLSQVSGEVVATAPELLTLDVQTINSRNISLFDFTGTGGAGTDADPAAYEVDVYGLTLTDIDVNDPVKARGFVTSFGSAPADFKAQSVVDVSNTLDALLRVTWVPASATAFSVIDDQQLTLDLDGVGAVHHVLRRGIVSDLQQVSTAPVVRPVADLYGRYALREGASVQVFFDFAEFSSALADSLAGSQAVNAVTARGRFDDDSATLTTRGVLVNLQ